MPFQRLTLTELQAQIAADIESRLPGADSQLRRSFLSVLAKAIAGALHGLYGFLNFTSKQVFPDTAEAEFLDRWAGIWGVARKSAWPSAGAVTFTGTNGSVIPAGTDLQRGDGALYQTSAEGTIAAGTVDVDVQAVEPGSAGNADVGVVINLVAPIAGVQSSGAVADDGSGGGLTQGSDEESDAALLARLLLRIQQPPHGGARRDYVGWSLDKESHGLDVTRAWDYPQELGLGTVTVRFMMDGTYADGIPQAADVAALQAYIDLVRPVTADVTVVAPVAVPIAFEISGLNPVTQTVKDAIEAELKDLIRREAEPGGTLLVSHIREAISIAAGENDHFLVTPAADVVSATGEISTFGDITWS
ncbi:MAG: baseplate J/gp47 family protein [Alphaproteobacteria bacterium]|nr:baseplate J/gp47 family protein [Alphaproteobacteria bacterium]